MAQALAIRVLRLLGDQGMAVNASVACPKLGAAVPIDDCRVCGNGQVTFDGTTGRGSVVMCSWSESPRRLARSVAQVMARDVICLPATMPAEEAMSWLTRAGIGIVTVIDTEHHPVGMVTRSDLRARPASGSSTVADVMAVLTATLAEDASLAHAARVMAQEGSPIPIVDSTGVMVGVLFPVDVVWWAESHEGDSAS